MRAYHFGLWSNQKVFERIATSTPTSASIERVHSLYTLLLSKLRARMGDNTVIQLVFLKANDLYGVSCCNWKSVQNLKQLQVELELEAVMGKLLELDKDEKDITDRENMVE